MSMSNVAALMNAIRIRHSTRTFNGEPLEQAHEEILRRTCQERLDFAEGIRIEFVINGSKDIFTGPSLKNTPAYIAMIGENDNPHIYEAIGYFGEYVILTATSLGLGTCWVSGTFRSEAVAKSLNLESDREKVYAVSPLGYSGRSGLMERMTKTLIRSSYRKPLEELILPESLATEEWPEWVGHSLNVARMAPSAVNRQPWRFSVSSSSIKVSMIDPKNVTQRLDCGIAMLHMELGALSTGVSVHWRHLESPEVAELRCK
jgi:nitroreductase